MLGLLYIFLAFMVYRKMIRGLTRVITPPLEIPVFAWPGERLRLYGSVSSGHSPHTRSSGEPVISHRPSTPSIYSTCFNSETLGRILKHDGSRAHKFDKGFRKSLDGSLAPLLPYERQEPHIRLRSLFFLTFKNCQCESKASKNTGLWIIYSLTTS